MATFLDLTERIFLPRTNFFAYEMFLNQFRFTKETFKLIFIHVQDFGRSNQRNNSLSVGLRYFPSGTLHSVIGSENGVSQSTSFQCIELFSMQRTLFFLELFNFQWKVEN